MNNAIYFWLLVIPLLIGSIAWIVRAVVLAWRDMRDMPDGDGETL